MCVFGGEDMYHSISVEGIGQLAVVNSVQPLCWYQRSTSNGQTWHQVLLPTEASWESESSVSTLNFRSVN